MSLEYHKEIKEAISIAISTLNNKGWDKANNGRIYTVDVDGELYPPKEVLRIANEF